MQIVALLTIGLAISPGIIVADTDYYQRGHNHLYNLEYDEAIADFAKLIETNPADPIPYNQLPVLNLLSCIAGAIGFRRVRPG